MIGNRIKFKLWVSYKADFEEAEGIVVDAWTEVKGKVKGDVFIGFGDVKGGVDSKRMYKVERILPYSKQKVYENVEDWKLIEVLEFAVDPKSYYLMKSL